MDKELMPMYQSFPIRAFDKYLTSLGSSKKTRKNYLADIDAFLSWVSEKKQMTIATPQKIDSLSPEDFLTYLFDISRQKQISTSVRFTSSVKAFIQAMVAIGLFSQDKSQELLSVVTLPARELSPTNLWKMILKNKGVPQDIIKRHISHVEDFLQWRKSQITKL